MKLTENIFKKETQ